MCRLSSSLTASKIRQHRAHLTTGCIKVLVNSSIPLPTKFKSCWISTRLRKLPPTTQNTERPGSALPPFTVRGCTIPYSLPSNQVATSILAKNGIDESRTGTRAKSPADLARGVREKDIGPGGPLLILYLHARSTTLSRLLGLLVRQ